MRIVAQEANLPIILLTPVNKPAKSLKILASRVRHINPYISSSQFPDPVVRPDGKEVFKPPTW